MSERPATCPICGAASHIRQREDGPVSTDPADYEVAEYACGAWWDGKTLCCPASTSEAHVKHLRGQLAEVERERDDALRVNAEQGERLRTAQARIAALEAACEGDVDV